MLATVPAGGAADVDAAVRAARRAARGCRTALRQPRVAVGPRRPGQTRSTPG
ncbi:hypothetical protein [Kitasatospora aureofaciens]|uniref:hypothetical protein n=1 Tax=Kitasatospora aureofaciens TaxID=1894 RepID=UPI00325B21E7